MDSLVGYIKLMGFEEVAQQLNAYSARMRGQAATTKQSLDSSEGAWKSYNNSVSSSLSGISGKLKGLLAAAGIGIGLAATISYLKRATAAANEFEKQWDAVETRLSSADFPAASMLKVQVEDMAISMREGVGGLTTGLATVLDAAFAPAEAMGILKDSTILAKGGLMETGKAAEDVTTILRAFNLDASDSGRVIDVIANAADKGRGSIAAFSGGMAGTARYASDMGLSIEELGGILATTTAKGEPLERTLAALRLILRQVTDEDEKSVAAKQKLGIEIENGKLKSGQFLEILQKLTGAEQKDIEAILGEGRARGTVNLLLANTADLTRNITVEMEKMGQAQEIANRAMAGTHEKFAAVGLAAEGMKRAVGAGIAELLSKSGLLEGLASSLQLVTRAIQNLSYASSVDLLKFDVSSAIKAYDSERIALEGLIKKHGELTETLKDAKPGSMEYAGLQNELYKAIEDIVAIVPEARTEISEYGSSFGINIAKVNAFTQAQRELLQITLQIKQTEAELKVAEGKSRYEKAKADLESYTAELNKYQKVIDDLKAGQKQSIFGDVIKQDTIDQLGTFRGGLVRATDLLSSSEKMAYGFGKAQDQLRVKIAEARKEMLDQQQAEAALKLITGQLNDLLKAGTISQGDFDKAVAKAAGSLKAETEAAAQTTVVVDKLTAAQKKHQEIIGGINWSDYYGDQERLSGKTTNQIIDDIERLMEQYERENATGSKAYRELADLRVEYAEKAIEENIKAEQEAAQRITAIWDGVGEDVKSSISDLGADALLGEADFSSFGDRIKESFAHGFSEALLEKSGFDLAFKNNMLDLGGFASNIFGGSGGGGLIGGLSAGFSSITDWLGITSTEVQGLGEGLGDVSIAAGETGAALDFAGAQNIIETTEAAKDAAPALAATGDAATKAAPALTKAGQGLAGINLALPATGLYLAAISGQFGETAQKISLVGTEAAALTVALGPMGALIGGVAGTLAHFGHQVFGIGGQHITFEEQFSGYLEDLQNGTKTQEEVFRQLYLRTTNYANDFWGTQSDLLKQSYAERLAYYNKFAELKDSAGASLFSEDQLNKLKDALQLFDTVEERAAAAQRTASEVAREVFTTKVWETFREVPYLLDEVGQVGPVFSAAFDEAQASGEDFTEVFKRRLMELPGISQQALDLILEAFGQTTSEITDEIETAAGGYRDMWAAAAEGISSAGSSAEEFFKNVQDVSGMWLKGWDIDINEALMQIPGMTAEVKNALMDELRGLKESGATDFQIADTFKESVVNALNDPSIREAASSVSEMLRTAFSGIEGEPIELGRIFDTAGLKSFVKQLSTVKGGWNGIIESVQEFRAELEASGQTAESAGDDIYKHLRNSLSEIPGITQEMVQTMERLIRSGDWRVLVDVSERGLDDVLNGLKGIPSKINVGVTASESRGVSPGAILDGLVNRMLQMVSPPSFGGSFTPAISAAASGSLATLASSASASGRGDKHYHITLTIPGGEFGDRQFWDNVVRNKIQPALDAIEARG